MTLSEEQRREIDEARRATASTMRPTVPALEAIMFQPIPVLDHGFVRVIDYMGDDGAVVQAARVSYGRGTRRVSEDRGLIAYLARHWHTTPFEMCLDGDMRVATFPCAGAMVKHYTMRDLATAFAEGGRANSWAKLVYVRTVDPATGNVLRTRIKRAWKTGLRLAYRVRVAELDREIVLTDNHPLLCEDRVFRPLRQLRVGARVCLNGRPATAPEVVEQVTSMRDAGKRQADIAGSLGVSMSLVSKVLRPAGKGRGFVARRTGLRRKAGDAYRDPHRIARGEMPAGPCAFCAELGLHVHHKDEDKHNNDWTNLIRLCPKHHKHAHTHGLLKHVIVGTIASIEPVGEREVFDLEVESEHHNFIAEGFVVHNCEIKLHVKLPIFVARQWIRHRTASINEVSARYSVLDSEFYLPDAAQLKAQSAVNRQGRGDALGPAEAGRVLDLLREDGRRAHEHYSWMLNEEADGARADPDRDGLARELARINLTLATYTQWYWKTNLHNLMNFLRLRADGHAQYEIRVYAEAMTDVMARWVPLCHEAFLEHRLGAVTLSRSATAVVRRLVAGEPVDAAASGLNPREWRELAVVLGLKASNRSDHEKGREI